MIKVPSHFSPQTHAAISQRNKLYTRGDDTDQFNHFLGAISSFGITDARDVTDVRGIGMGDRFIELVPGYSSVYTITVARTMFYMSNLQQELGYKSGVSGFVRALRHHKYPFDIRQELVFSELVQNHSDFDQDNLPAGVTGMRFPESDGENSSNVNETDKSVDSLYAIVTLYLACWLTSNNATYETAGNLVSENGNISVTDICDGATNLYQNMLWNTGNEVSIDEPGRSFVGNIRYEV